MTAGRTRGGIGRSCGVWMMAAGVLILCGPAAGQSYWAGRAREVAAARLAAQQVPARADDARHTEAGKTPAPRKAAKHDRPVFRLAANPATAPAGETPADETSAGQPPAEPAAPVAQEVAGEVQRGPLPNFFKTVARDVRESPRSLWHDTKAVYGNPWNLAFLVGAGGASVALRPEADDDIEDHYHKHHSFGQSERDTLDALANPGTAFAVAGLMYVGGQALQECKTYEVGKRALSALIITDTSTLLLKLAANTESPNGSNFGWPSGHVSSTMALATVLNDAYGPLVGVPMFGLTALSGIERLDSREHHFSDVIFGAALGWVVGETVMKEHRPEIFGGQIVPYCDPSRACAGVAWVKTLGD